MKIRRSASGLFTRVFYDDGTDEIVPTQASDQFIEKFFEEQAENFNHKFGRYPTSNDPFVFDPEQDEPTNLSPAKMEDWVLKMLDEKGVSAHDRYAFQMTGHLVNVETKPMMTAEEIIRWFAAVSAWEQDNHQEVFVEDGVNEQIRSMFNDIKKQHYLIVDKITENDPDNFISKLIANVLLSSCALNYRMFSDAGYLLCETIDHIAYCVPPEEQSVAWREFLSLLLLLAFQHIQQGVFRDPDQMDLAMAMADVFNSDGDLVELVNKFELSSADSADPMSVFAAVLEDVAVDPFMALAVCAGIFGSLMHNDKLSAGLSFEILHLPGRQNFQKFEILLEELEDDRISVEEFSQRLFDVFPFINSEKLFDSYEDLDEGFDDDFEDDDFFEDEEDLSFRALDQTENVDDLDNFIFGNNDEDDTEASS